MHEALLIDARDKQLQMDLVNLAKIMGIHRFKS